MQCTCGTLPAHPPWVLWGYQQTPTLNTNANRRQRHEHIGHNADHERTVKLCLLNARSVCNKADFLVDFVVDHNLDILCLTETRRRYQARTHTPCLQPLSDRAAIYLSMLLGVTVEAMMSVRFHSFIHRRQLETSARFIV